MKTRPLLPSILVATLALPPPAFAQGPSTPVQPVPYAPSQPVPYPGASDPAVVNVPRAAPAGGDVVYLRGGGMIRGTLIEAIPNDHATVDLGTGQSAVIPWDRIERIERGGASSSPPSALPAPRPGALPPAPGPEGTAVVHIEADAPVVLDRREGRSWVFTCNAPCDAELPLAGTYRISGSGVRNSGQFRLNARPGEHVVLDVTTASSGGFAGGIVLTSVGAFAFLVGGMILLTVATIEAANSAAGVPNSSSDGSVNTVGWVMFAGGAAATVVGILVLTGNSHSKVDQAPAAPRPRNDAWLRVPQWREDKVGAGLPKVVGVPLFQTTF